MESLYKQATLQIVNEYKKDNSIEGIRKILEDIDKGVYPHLAKIVQENIENPFFTPEEAKIMKQLYNEHKSFSFLKHVILMDSLAQSIDKDKILNQFYSYLEQQNALCFCGEKYLSKDQQHLLLMVKQKKDEFKIAYQKRQEELKIIYQKKQEKENIRTEEYVKIANKLIEFYIQTKDFDKTITYAKENLEISPKKMINISSSLKNVNLDNKDVLCKIGRKIIVNKWIKYIDEIIDSLDENITMATFDIWPSKLQEYIISVETSGLISNDEKMKLDKFYKNYVDYCMNMRNQAKDISLEETNEMSKVIEGYMENEMLTIEQYCELINIKVNDFHKIVAILRDLNPRLIEKYDNYVKNKSSKMYGIIVSKVREIIPMIKNGVELENSSLRPFDILDYYMIISVKINELLEIVKSQLSSDDYFILRRFVKKYEIDKKLNYDFEYNTKHIVHPQYDLNGNFIPNTGREVTLEEKEEIINYLKINSIPITNNTYHTALNRWIKGQLILDNQSNIKEIEEQTRKR